MDYFNNKTVYITGGSGGIGLELAKKIYMQGSDMVLLARNEDKLKNAVLEVEKYKINEKQKVNYLSVDVADYKKIKDKLIKGVELYGEPDILINNAGISTGSTAFENMSYETFDKIIQTNLYGVWNITSILFDYLKNRKGHIVIISSAAGLFGMHSYTAYGTSKGALNIFAESLRYETKPYGMDVTLVCPPEVDTPLIDSESPTLSPQGRKMKSMVGLLTTDFVAKEILKYVAKKRFCVIPGFRTKVFYFLHRVTNGWSSRFFSDLIIKRV